MDSLAHTNVCVCVCVCVHTHMHMQTQVQLHFLREAQWAKEKTMASPPRPRPQETLSAR